MMGPKVAERSLQNLFLRLSIQKVANIQKVARARFWIKLKYK